MSSYNKVILMGNLTRDPELRFTGNNMAICKFGLAVNRRFKDGASGEWKEEPTFVDVTIFGARAEPFARFHSKGKQAFIEGSLRLDTWEDKNGGGKRSKLYVVAENWEFVGSGGGARGEPGGPGGPGGSGGLGASGGPGSGAAVPASSSSAEGESGAPQREPELQQVDDTPF